jgi:galactose mutarotase-like enzyme
MSVASDPPTACITLCNGSLRVCVVPEEGGRIASLCDTDAQVEYLLQPGEPYRRPARLNPWDRFEISACAGIDECLPSVGACGPETPGGPVPDHGDFWRLHWAVSTSDNNSLSMAATGYSRPLLFEKRLRLRASALEIHSSIRNQRDAPVPFLYALHPLLAIDPGDRIVLPPEVSRVRVESSRHDRVGAPGATIAWAKPGGAGSALDLSRAEAISAGTAEMFYTDRLQSGWCGLYRARHGQGICLRFDARLLPYLGLWLCFGGWPEDESRPRQYAVAFEPTVAPRGTLASALESRQAPVLAAHESFDFDMVLEQIGPAPLAYEEFVAQCSRETFV